MHFMIKKKIFVLLLAVFLIFVNLISVSGSSQNVSDYNILNNEFEYNPTHPEISVQRKNNAIIDYSNVSDGYVMVKYDEDTDKRLKVQVISSKNTYTYNLEPCVWTVFPLSEGNDVYKVSIYKNVYDSKYSSVLSYSFSVSLKNEFLPFLYSNQYVDYSGAINTKAKAKELIDGLKTDLEKVEAVYNFVVNNITYDKVKAMNVKTGYLPVLDSVIEKKSGICFDYAALMSGMLRSVGIPCKLVVGFAGNDYHAWVSVWTKESGWIENIIKFDGEVWHRMDPTFVSSSNSNSILKFINEDSNYIVKYCY